MGGWLRDLGALDFAGGTVVHISSGVSALACALILGKRHGYGHQPIVPHNLPLTLIGASLLWFGWFGFNAGSAVTAGALATSAFVVTNTATATAALAWMTAEWIYHGRPTVLGAASGAVAGLVAITPASGYVGPISALWIGVGAGVFCYLAVVARGRLGFVDALDAFALHGVGGSWGAIATGLFASTAINPAGADGLFFGNPAQLGVHLNAVLATWLFAFFGTSVLPKIVDALVRLRVNDEDEMTGLDLTQHNEAAYSLGAPMVGAAGTFVPTPPPRPAPKPAAAPEASRSPSLVSSRRPPAASASTASTAQRETQAAATSEELHIEDRPFELLIQGADPQALKAVWKQLCYDYPTRTPREFNALFPHVATFNGTTLRFRRGDPHRFREHLQQILALYGLSQARVELPI